MKFVFLFAVALLITFKAQLYAQGQAATRLYAHKVVVDSIAQTKAYTYLKVKEQINGKDSIQWLALPIIEPKIGDVYYFEGGLQMGEFKSKELNRTFKQIMFLGNLGTSPEMSDKNLVPAPVMDTIPVNTPPVVLHTVKVKEVIHTTGYTYLRVKEDDKEEWLAIVKMAAKVGQTYTYDDAALMTDFTSKELKRTFKEVLFIAKLTLVTEDKSDAKKKKVKKSSVKAKQITIANLLEKKDTFSDKTVQITGKVTKYSSDILGKNWIHVEDGTDFLGKFDLTVTTKQEVKVGDSVVAEGRIVLNKDFGSGYFFEVLMEDATIQVK